MKWLRWFVVLLLCGPTAWLETFAAPDDPAKVPVAKIGDTLVVSTLSGATLDSKSIYSNVESGRADPEAIEALIRHGLAFNPKTDGATLLVLAAWANNVPLIKWLLSHDVDPNVRGVLTVVKGHPLMALPLNIADKNSEAAVYLRGHGAKTSDAP
jgi:hypothetical protein